MSEPLLEIRDLHIAFGSGERRVDAVRGVDLTVYPGQTVAIVGSPAPGNPPPRTPSSDCCPVRGGSNREAFASTART